ncbi:hypothetical protein Purlil1_12769 [Purpureocillium lilacinum]|uniref:Nephrocystin 3-like N-terminal domain-containing protein n=1 Tax=Purpureocillium lilacinum TaxID=33203 RepID=A0ABR0BFY1_PURLI|nr:hypothetical protein Purlil1_12769 [Purpureocillium lilacinum]
MEGLGVAANIAAILDLAARITSSCLQYSKDVKNAKHDIAKLRRHVLDLQHVAEALHVPLVRPGSEGLRASQQLRNSIRECQSQLQALHKRLGPRTTHEAWSWLGLRSFQWPYQSKELEKIIQDVGRCAQTMNLALQIDQTSLLLNLHQRIVLTYLEDEVVVGASFDARDDEHRPACLPNTCVHVLQEILGWTLSPQTDLVRNIPSIARHVKDAIHCDPTILRGTLREQFKKLIRLPISMTPPDSPSLASIAIILDAVDECEREDEINLLIHLLSRPRTSQRARLKVFLTSRPELLIHLGFESPSGNYRAFKLYHIPEQMIERDICTFLEHELTRIKVHYNSHAADSLQLARDWPNPANVESLVKMAVPLFFYASTICRFLADRRIETPDKLLQKVLLPPAGRPVSQLETTSSPVLENLITETNADLRNNIIHEFRGVQDEMPRWIHPQPKVNDSWDHCLQTIEAHDDLVVAVAFSHDSALVASGSHGPSGSGAQQRANDMTIRLWCVATGECLRTFSGHGKMVTSVAFSPEFTLLVSGSHDSTVRLWRTVTGECVQTLKRVGALVGSAAFSHDSTPWHRPLIGTERFDPG